MKPTLITATSTFIYLAFAAAAADYAARVQDEKVVVNIDLEHAAVVVVDAWDDHWCADLRERIRMRGARVASFVEHMRDHGVTIIHAPKATRKRSDAERDAERNAEAAPHAPLPPIGELPNIPLESFRGMTLETCVTGEEPESIRKHVHDRIRVSPEDYWLEDVQRLWNVVQDREIDTLLYVGFVANSCVTGREFGLLALKMRGLNTYLIRDLTDVGFTVTDDGSGTPLPNDQALDLWAHDAEAVIGPTLLSTDMMREPR